MNQDHLATTACSSGVASAPTMPLEATKQLLAPPASQTESAVGSAVGSVVSSTVATANLASPASAVASVASPASASVPVSEANPSAAVNVAQSTPSTAKPNILDESVVGTEEDNGRPSRDTTNSMVQLVIISGRSGSGKTVALRALEDLGYYCIDNLPVNFLLDLTTMAMTRYPKLAVSIDIRNIPDDESYLASLITDIKHNPQIHSTIIFCDADDQVLIKRYSETRRLHPLSKKHLSLSEAIVLERTKLSNLAGFADLRIDTSDLSVHDLANEVVTAILGSPEKHLVMVFESFGFKNGIAKDADFVFDARFLPNPFWEKELRRYTGLDQPVIDFFKRYASVGTYIKQIDDLLHYWLREIESSNRSYLTVSIGCTGGCHRSVYIAQSLANLYKERGFNVQVRHRSLEDKGHNLP